MIKLTREQILHLHKELINQTGGSHGVKSLDLLDSAINAPFQSFDYIELFPSLQQKATRLGYGIIMNHPFIDGNKRTGAHTMLVFLSLNGIELEYTQNELSEVILNVASSKYSYEKLLEWVINHQI